MSRRNIKPTTFHDDSRSSDAGSVVTAPPRPKPRTIKDPVKEFPPLRDSRAVDPHPNGVQTSNAKLPPLGPDGEIQVDFNALPTEALLKYKHHYNLVSSDPPPAKKAKTSQSHGKKRPHDDSDEGPSNSEDESPYRFDLGAWRPRINRTELAKSDREHFAQLPPPRENETIVQFLYAVKTQGIVGFFLELMVDKALKLRPDS